MIATLKLLVIFRALCQGILYWQVIFCEKATIDFRRMLCEVSSVCHLQTQWNGDGCHFSRFHSLYTNIERKGTKECKQKREGISSGKQKKIKVNFVLGIWPRTLEIQIRQSLRSGVMFQNTKYAF